MQVSAKDIKNHRNDCSEFYSRFISMRFSAYISAFCINHKVTPNQITAMMLYSVLVCLLFLMSSNYMHHIIGAFLLFSINIFDTSDGEVARYTNKTSNLGIYYDKLFQLVVDLMVFAVVAYNQYLYFGDLLHVIPSVIFIFFYMVDSYFKEFFALLQKESEETDIKNIKLQVSYERKDKLQFFLHITSSNTGFFHLYWVFLLIDYILDTSYIFQFSFIMYLMLLQIVKTVIRQYKIIKILQD